MAVRTYPSSPRKVKNGRAPAIYRAKFITVHAWKLVIRTAPHHIRQPGRSFTHRLSATPHRLAKPPLASAVNAIWRTIYSMTRIARLQVRGARRHGTGHAVVRPKRLAADPPALGAAAWAQSASTKGNAGRNFLLRRDRRAQRLKHARSPRLPRGARPLPGLRMARRRGRNSEARR